MLTSEKLVDDVERLNCGGTSFTAGVPSTFHNEDCARMFLRGVLDGDGNVHLIKSRSKSNFGNTVGCTFRAVKGSLDFIQGVIDLINTHLPTACSLSWATVRGVKYPKLEMTKGDSALFFDWVYRGFVDFKRMGKKSPTS